MNDKEKINIIHACLEDLNDCNLSATTKICITTFLMEIYRDCNKRELRELLRKESK